MPDEKITINGLEIVCDPVLTDSDDGVKYIRNLREGDIADD